MGGRSRAVVVVVVAHRTPHRSVPSIERVDRWDKTIGLGVGAAGAADASVGRARFLDGGGAATRCGGVVDTGCGWGWMG